HMKEGREFVGESDTMNLILNEAAVKRLHLADPLNKLIRVEYTTIPMRVIGVVRDAVMGSPFEEAIPTLFVYNSKWAGTILLRLPPKADLQDELAGLKRIYSKYNPSYPFVYNFVDEEYAHKFDSETSIGKLIALFATLAILISCLGLFGLAAYLAERRAKEIGIRKIMGASLWQLWRLLSTEFLVLVGIACAIASPVSYYLLKGWLQGYSYRIDIGAGVFLLAAGLALVIAGITVSSQIGRAALVNPIKSLRN